MRGSIFNAIITWLAELLLVSGIILAIVLKDINYLWLFALAVGLIVVDAKVNLSLTAMVIRALKGYLRRSS
jgi:hypothetical protein